MKKVVVKYYSRLNLGDDLFIVLLANEFPDISFRLLGNPLYIFRIKNRPKNLRPQYIKNLLLSGVSFLSCRFRSLDKFYRKLEKVMQLHADVFIHISGSIFMETSQKDSSGYLEPAKIVDFESAIEERKNKTNQTSCNKKGKVIIGANIGPVYTEEYLQNIKKDISNCLSVCVRDLYSYELCRDLDNVAYAPDVIFNLKRANKLQKKENRKSVVFSIINAKAKAEFRTQAEKYFKLLAKSIDELSNEYNIELVSFCEREGDMEGINEIYNHLSPNCNKTNIRIHNYKGNLEDIIGIIEYCDFVVASRFHSMILGLLFNKPIFPICYGAKMMHYLNDVKFIGRICTPYNIDKLNVDDLLFNFRNNYICDCEKHRSNAYMQFEVLRQLLYD